MYDRIVNAARSAVWLMEKTKLDDIWAFDAAQAGIQMDGPSWQVLAASNRERAKVRNQSAVGVIPVIGTIAHRVGLLEEASGGVSTQHISRSIDQLMAMDDVGSIVSEIDSPGGVYDGMPELANKVYELRGNGKRLIAHINTEAGSGALWLASAFEEVVITPSGSAGSVGAYTVHEEVSELNESLGIKRRYISYGEYKTEGNRDEPLSDEIAAYLQERVDRVGQEFESALAKFRGVSTKHVRDNFGRGRMLDAKAAVAAGMVDRIATFEDTLSAQVSGRKRNRSRVENAKKLLEL